MDGWIEQHGFKDHFSMRWSQTPNERSGPNMNSYELNENVFLTAQQGISEFQVQGLHIVVGREGWVDTHAATAMPLLELTV